MANSVHITFQEGRSVREVMIVLLGNGWLMTHDTNYFDLTNHLNNDTTITNSSYSSSAISKIDDTVLNGCSIKLNLELINTKLRCTFQMLDCFHIKFDFDKMYQEYGYGSEDDLKSVILGEVFFPFMEAAIQAEVSIY